MAKATDALKGRPGELRRGLMLYGSTAALAAALMLAEGGVGPAFAQAIGPRVTSSTAAQGDFTVPGASPTPFFETRSGSLDIVHMNRDAVLNWTTYDTAAPGGANGSSYVNFLPEGTELRFVGNGESFTAINRVFTTPDAAGNYRGIAFRGAVTSYLSGDGPNFNGPVGGNIWFYSPGGILATGTASFNVGSLLLSVSDLDNFSDYGYGRQVEFTGVADPFAAVILQPGARVTLTQPNSSFGVFAPTIEQGGDVTVNGSVLYMSGVRGGMYFYSDGSIGGGIYEAPVAGNKIRHLGTTTGPASLATDDYGVFDTQTIEFRTSSDVNVLLSGSIGYAPATEAALGPNGSIVLSVGGVSTSGDLTLTSNTSIEAFDAAELSFGAGERLTMGGDANGGYSLTVNTPEGSLSAGAGGIIDIAGDVRFSSLYNSSADFALSAAGADANNASGGTITIGGSLLLDATSGRYGAQGQDQGRIEASIGNGGSLTVGGAMGLHSDAIATGDDDGLNVATAGRATLTMTGANASLSVGDSLIISAQALSRQNNCECSPPSGSGAGGYAAFTATGGSVRVGQLSVSASAESYQGYYASDGAILDATGGTALVSLGDSNASFSSVVVSAEAFAAGGDSGLAGGNATGGTASFSKGSGGSLATQGLVVTADADGGEGSDPDGETHSASRGGDARGGTASISLAQNAQGLGYLDLSARARAGDGGSGVEYSGESGADGGDAIGGTATLVLSGAGTNLAGVVEGSLNVSASGGSGGDAEGDYYGSLQVGNGGSGGSARGGTLSITAADGAEFSWNGSFNGYASGGSGGRGADQSSSQGALSDIGRGGSGGDAVGASFALIAQGGTISGDVQLLAEAFGGEGGTDGLDIDGNFSGGADSGSSTGGSIALTLRNAGAGRFDVGSTQLVASGETAGSIAITDESSDPGALMRFRSLYAEAQGDRAGDLPSFSLSSAANAISVEGTAEVYASSIGLAFAGSGRLEVGGFTFLSATRGDITITHSGNTGVQSLHSNGPVEVYANGEYIAGAGSVVASDDYALIRATEAIAASDTRSLGSVTMISQGDLTVGNVAAGYDVSLYAGRLDFDGAHGYQPSARAKVTGTITAGYSVLIESGGFAEFAAGSQVRSDNDIRVRTGDDIVIAAGASLVSDISPLDLESIHLLAGDINFGPFSGDLIEPIPSPIASLVIGGTLDTNGGSLYLSGDAIDGTGSSISTGNLYVDVTDAPPFGPFSNDDGLLADACRQGSVCLGSIAATGDVEIGRNGDSNLISLRIGSVDFTGGSFEAVTTERLDIGFGDLAASESIFLRSVNDAVALGAITLEAPEIRLLAGTDLIAGAATLIGSNVSIDVGNDIAVGTIFAGNGLDDGSESAVFSAPGNFSVGSLSYGGGTEMRISADGDLSIGYADPGGRGIDLEADGVLFLGATAAGSGSIALEGDAVSFNTLRSTGSVSVFAGDDGIAGFSEGGLVIDAAGGIGLSSVGDILLGDLRAGTDIAISGASVSASGLSAGGSLAVESDGELAVGGFDAGDDAALTGRSLELGSGTAGGSLSAEATAGMLGFSALESGGDADLAASGALAGGDVAAGGALTLVGASITVGEGSGAAGLSATSDGAIGFSSLASSGGAVNVDGGGVIGGGAIAAAASASLTGGAVTMDTITAGGALSLSATSLRADSLVAGGALDVATTGATTVDTFASGNDARFAASALDLGSGTVGRDLAARTDVGALSFDALQVGGNAGLASAGAILGGAIDAGGTLSLAGSSLAIGGGSGDAGVSATIAGNAGFTELASLAGAVSLESGGEVAGGAASAAGAISIAGSSVALDSASFGNGLTLVARSGDLAGTGLYKGSGPVSLIAAQGIAIVSVDTLGGIALTAGDEARFVALRSRDGSVGVTAGGAIAGSSVAADGSEPAGDDNVSLVAGGAISLDGSSSAQDDFSARAGGAVAIAGAQAGRDLALEAGSGTVGGANLTAGRDLSLSGQSVDLIASTVARNLTVRATAGNVTGSGATTAGGAIDVAASGTIALGTLQANGGALSASAGGSIGFTVLGAAGSLSLTAGGAVTGGVLSAGGSATVDSAGAIALTGLTASGGALRSTGGTVSASAVGVGGLLEASGTSVTLAAPGALRVDASASAGGIGITSGGDLRVDAMATGNIALASTGGSVFIGNAGQPTDGGEGIGTQSVAGGAGVTVTAANAIAVADSLTAAGALAMTAGGTVSLNGSATGSTVDLRAADLAIASTGSLGTANTQRISLASSAPVNLGAGANSGFAVDAAEFGRMRSGGDLMIAALAGTSTGAGSLTVGSLTVTAGSGGQLGASGTFGLTANGVLDINNALSIAGASSGSTLMLTGDAIDLDYANAALSVLDGASAATGRIVVNGRLITSVSASAATDIAGKTPEQINTRLGLADVVRDIGLFRTANLTLQGQDAILIQNSGGAAVDERRGLSVGALTVTGRADGSTLVVINGIVANATGIGAAQNVTVTTPIAGGSTVNGCALANIAGCLVVPEPEVPLIVAPESILFGTTDLIQSEEEDDEVEDGVADGKPEAPPIDTTRIDDPAGLPMIDDPVTGAGNEDLWQQPDE